MTVRTTRKNVTFRRPFSIRGADGAQPPGTYTVETDEEQLPGLSFLAYLPRSSYLLHTGAPPPGR
jgi:hypothetical protein